VLKQISIKNFAIFEDASFEPGAGFNVITGESGAGKSVVVNALSLIRGARAYKEMIRTGTDFALVEAVFEISDNKMKQLNISENTLVITRRINSERISECRINNKIRPLSEIVEITGNLIDIHGQYENQTLADSENHLAFLDAFAGEILENKLSDYNEKLNEYNHLIKEIIFLSGSDSERERNKEIYSFQLKEIEAAGLADISEEELLEKWEFMKNSEKFMKETEKAYNLLENERNSPYEIVSEVYKILTALPENSDIDSVSSKLNEASYLLLETISELRDFKENNTFDQFEYEQLGETIDNLKKLKRKYGGSVEEILLYHEKISKELEQIENYEKNNDIMLKKVATLERGLLNLDAEMMEIRRNKASLLKEKLLVELDDMGMGDSEFIIELTSHRRTNSLGYIEFGKNGLVSCEFLISLNKGLQPQTLGRVASGGEMSRIMLAFKTLYTFKDDTETIVFDEIDSGLSGEASKTVAAKLAKLSSKKQIICITHLPQIAAGKGLHFIIEKLIDNDFAKAFIRKAESVEDVIKQIASLTDGENLTEESLMHARSLYRRFN
jgi:DNA repair protein RecN (Recombination protein N)